MEEDEVMNKKNNILENVYYEIDRGNMNHAYNLIKPLLDIADSEAQFIYAMYIAHENESAEEYDLRNLKFLRLSANQLYPPALYELGVCYQHGMGVTLDEKYASELFKQAADLGYGKAKLSYAIDLYLGRNNIKKDEDYARSLISDCVNNGVEGADSLMKELETKKGDPS